MTGAFHHITKPSKEKILLNLDGHKSHKHNISALGRASECGIIMLSLPPHTSHKMPPLDITFFKPLKTYYYQAIEHWMRDNAGRGVTLFQVCKFFGIAYSKVAIIGSAENGFRKAGICPINALIFNDDDFCPAEVTDRPLPLLENSSNNLFVEQCGDSVPPISLQNDTPMSPELPQVIHRNTPKSAMVNVEEIIPLLKE